MKKVIQFGKFKKQLKVAKSTVQDSIKRWKESGSYEDKERTGRPRATSLAEDRAIVLISKINRKFTAPEITAEFNRSHSKTISLNTTKRRLRQAGLFGRVVVKKPLLRNENKKKRLAWAKEHRNWIQEYWKKCYGRMNPNSRCLAKEGVFM